MKGQRYVLWLISPDTEENEGSRKSPNFWLELFKKLVKPYSDLTTL